MATKDDIITILKKINNGWDYAISDYATSDAEEEEYEHRKEEELDNVAELLLNIIKGENDACN